MTERSTTPHVDPVLLNPTQLSMRIGINVDTLRKWRLTKRGPAFVKPGNKLHSRVRYPIEEVIAWEQSLTRQGRSTPEGTTPENTTTQNAEAVYAAG